MSISSPWGWNNSWELRLVAAEILVKSTCLHLWSLYGELRTLKDGIVVVVAAPFVVVVVAASFVHTSTDPNDIAVVASWNVLTVMNKVVERPSSWTWMSRCTGTD